jgi:hypothetical protein
LATDGSAWHNQQLMAKLFDASKQNIRFRIINIFEDKELDEKSAVRDYLTAATG